MGQPMAACLARCHSAHRSVTRLIDTTPRRGATALTPDGIRPAETIAAALTGADAVAIMVATQASWSGARTMFDASHGFRPATQADFCSTGD